MAALEARLIAGETDRFNEEFDAGRKKALLGLAEEFDALTNPLADLVDQIFENSRYDNTQHNAMLRGVHFTSAAQTGASVNAADDTVTLQVLDAKALDEEQDANATATSDSYFLQDLFKRGVFPEAHLVRPNLRWEFRFRLLRLLAHALVLMIFLWLVAGFYLSFGHNTHYLDVVKENTHALAARVTAFYKKPEPEGTCDASSASCSITSRALSMRLYLSESFMSREVHEDRALDTSSNLREGKRPRS